MTDDQAKAKLGTSLFHICTGQYILMPFICGQEKAQCTVSALGAGNCRKKNQKPFFSEAAPFSITVYSDTQEQSFPSSNPMGSFACCCPQPGPGVSQGLWWLIRSHTMAGTATSSPDLAKLLSGMSPSAQQGTSPQGGFPGDITTQIAPASTSSSGWRPNTTLGLLERLPSRTTSYSMDMQK